MMGTKAKTETLVAAGEEGARVLTGHLLWMSTPFSVAPLPDGTYEFTVGSDVAVRVRAYCNRRVELVPEG